MRLSAHQSAYLPWFGYLQRIAISDAFVVLDNVQFEKNSFTNRNRIKNPNGINWLTVPVHLRNHLSQTVLDLEIANSNSWRKKHWKSIVSNYAKATEFSKHEEFFGSIYLQNWNRLRDLNNAILKYFLKLLEIDTPIYYQSELSIDGKKQDLILNLCEHFGSEAFIFGPEARNYVEPERFEGRGIDILFHEYSDIPYPQLWGDFVPNLSAIDVLFNCTLDEVRRRLRAEIS
jgi:hypothetical protein